MENRRSFLKALAVLTGAKVISDGELGSPDFEEAAYRFGEKAVNIEEESPAHATIRLENLGRRDFRMPKFEEATDHCFYELDTDFRKSLWSGEEVSLDLVYVNESVEFGDAEKRAADNLDSFWSRLTDFGYADRLDNIKCGVQQQIGYRCVNEGTEIVDQLKEAENTGDYDIGIEDGVLESTAKSVKEAWKKGAGLENLSVNTRKIDVEDFEEVYKGYTEDPHSHVHFFTTRSTERGAQGFTNDGYGGITVPPLLWEIDRPGEDVGDIDVISDALDDMENKATRKVGQVYMDWLNAHESGHAIGLRHNALDGWMSYDREKLVENIAQGEYPEITDFEKKELDLLRDAEIVEKDDKSVLKVEKPDEETIKTYLHENFEAYMNMLGFENYEDIDSDLGDPDELIVKGPDDLEARYWVGDKNIDWYENP